MFKNKAILMFASALLALPGALQAQGVTPTAAGKGNTVSADQLITRYSGLAGGPANAKSLVNGLRNGADISLSWTEQNCTQNEQGACLTRDPDTCSVYNDVCSTTPITTQSCSAATFPAGCKVGSSGCICTGQIISTTVNVTSCVAGTSTNGATCKTSQQGACTQYAPGACTKSESKTFTDTFSPGPAAPMGFGNVDIALALTEARLRPTATPTVADLKKTLLEILGKRAAGDGWGKIANSYGFKLQE